MASKIAIIIIPSQGKHYKMFDGVAREVNNKIYHGRAEVIKTRVSLSDTSPATVRYLTAKGSPFSWSHAHHITTVLTISHGYRFDGPNLAYGREDERYQVWGVNERTGELNDAGKKFWGKKVKNVLKSDGKIILVGCLMGAGNYARNVAREAGVKVYASKTMFAAADVAIVMKHVKAIEEGKEIEPMVVANP
ncbi:MAG TPA: hypothetical protein P5260_17275 [Candidatus Competibacter sp.]|nr:hypothetical protein [Candidatus Competibacter sp.]